MIEENGNPGAAREVAPPPRIVLVGRTNVGKSTLFNRLTRGRKALVAPTPGLTRDRREQLVQRGEWMFRLVDTGGLEFDSDTPFSAEIAEQVGVAVGEADAVWFVVDGALGITPLDETVYRWLLRQGKPLLTIVNKTDNVRRREEMVEFFALGAESLFPVSAMHGSGLEDALEATARIVPGIARRRSEAGKAAGTEAEPIRVALMGRPNVGKSSLVNAILGEARMIVSEIAGTTREPVDVPFEIGGQRFVLIDTAGIRRRAKIHDPIEKLGALTSIGALERCDVAVLVLDAEQGLGEQDARIAGYIQEQRRAVVLALNKWDVVSGEKDRSRDLVEDAHERLRFLEYAPLVKTSAAQGEGIHQLFQEVRKAFAQYSREIQTADLNRVVAMTTVHHPPPSEGRSATRIYYGTQVNRRPPVFRFFCNHPELLAGSYTRYFANQLRYHFGLKGTPIEVQWQGKPERERIRPAKRPSGKAKRPAKAPPLRRKRHSDAG